MAALVSLLLEAELDDLLLAAKLDDLLLDVRLLFVDWLDDETVERLLVG